MNDTLKTVEANGLVFSYVEQGEGPLALLMHGFPDTPHTWSDVIPKIAAKGYRVVAPYMRGYAPTQIPEHDTEQETLGRDVLALIDALGDKSATIIGHDWGASAVYGAAALGGDRIKKLITVGIPHPGTVRITPAKAWGVRHFVAYKLPGAAKRFAADNCAALRAIYKRWSPAWTPDDAEFAPIRESFANPASCDAAFGYYRALTFTPPKHFRVKIAVPTVVFSGEHDSVTDRSDYEHAQKMFTGEYVIEHMPGGHFLHREHPEEFAKRLLSHL